MFNDLETLRNEMNAKNQMAENTWDVLCNYFDGFMTRDDCMELIIYYSRNTEANANKLIDEFWAAEFAKDN